MKAKIITAVLALGFLAIASTSFASAPVANGTTTGHPCDNLRKTCEAAGFVKGEHKEGKGLFKDCVEPILAGKPVAGVSANQADVTACQAARAAKGHKN